MTPSASWTAALLTALGALALTGCPKPQEPTPGAAAGVPSAADWTEQHTERVQQACSRCHVAPAPDALPRARWVQAINDTAKMPGGDALDETERALAEAYYTRQAPNELPTVEQAPALSEKLRFRSEPFSPQDKKLLELKMPAVSNVRWAFLSDGRRRDLLVCDMRTSTLMILSPWREGEQRRIRRLGKDLNYPAHAELCDVNQDGRVDVLVAALGGMNPSNDTKGGAVLMLQVSGHVFVNHIVARGLGRVADLRAADMDGDKDLDLLVAAFGWRGPGKLQLLQCTSPPKTLEPSYAPKDLDDRDGFIHVEPVDLDGDGKLDLVALLSQEHEQVVAYLNRGGLQFEKKRLWQAPHPAWGFSGLELVDMDGDGDTDVLVSNGDALDDDLLKPYHGVSWLENQGGLKFTAHQVGPLYGCERAKAADMDGDGDLDVVAAAFLPQLGPQVWEQRRLDSLVWFERDGQAWIRHALEKGRCYHPTLDVADYDGDGKQDIAVGNFVWLEGKPTEQGKPNVETDYVTVLTQQ